MASKVYNTTITTAVKLIQGMSNNHYPGRNSLLLLFELINGELQRRRRQNLPKTPNNGAR